VKDKERAMKPDQSPFGAHLQSAVPRVEAECKRRLRRRLVAASGGTRVWPATS
jgi:hypothetical protein